MKVLILVTMMLTMNAYAGDDIRCINPRVHDLFYRVTSTNLEDYALKVTSREPDVGVVYKDILKGTDYQGALVLESKKTYMNLEDMDNVTYTYTKLINGEFRTISETLKCELL